MTDDEGLEFHAIIVTIDGERFTRETPNRRELLAWIEERSRPGAALIEIGMRATGPAVSAMLTAIRFGAARLEVLPDDRELPSADEVLGLLKTANDDDPPTP